MSSSSTSPKVKAKKKQALSSPTKDTVLSSPKKRKRGGKDINDQNESFWALSNTRRVTLRNWKGKSMIDIREFYEKDDEMLPGKKGISLTVQQYRDLKSIMNDIDDELGDDQK